MRVLITGGGGFVAPHVRTALQKRGAATLSAGHRASDLTDASVEITDGTSVAALIRSFRPDAIVHLAACSSVAECNRDPAKALAVNAGGTLNVLQGALALHAPCRVLLVSSGEVYGASAGTRPLSEQTVVEPMNVYGATKRAAEVLALQHRHLGLDVVIARPFNHLGKGQTPTFVLPSFAHQLAKVPRGEPVTLSVGNLAAVRDFSHVDDIAEGYALLLEKGRDGEIYNLCSGVGHSIDEMLQLLMERSQRRVTVTVDPTRMRRAEIPVLIGDLTKLKGLGWSPLRTSEQALLEVLEEAEQSRLA